MFFICEWVGDKMCLPVNGMMMKCFLFVIGLVIRCFYL